jgi:hypothetical protein
MSSQSLEICLVHSLGKMICLGDYKDNALAHENTTEPKSLINHVVVDENRLMKCHRDKLLNKHIFLSLNTISFDKQSKKIVFFEEGIRSILWQLTTLLLSNIDLIDTIVDLSLLDFMSFIQLYLNEKYTAFI